MVDVIKNVKKIYSGKKYPFLVKDLRYKEIRQNLNLFSDKYDDFKNGLDNNVEEGFLILIDTIEKLSNEVELNFTQPISTENFKNPIDEKFFKFMIDKKELSQKTARDYVNRVKQICDIDELLSLDINSIIKEYTIGEKRELNKRLHNSPSSALKKLKEFKEEILFK